MFLEGHAPSCPFSFDQTTDQFSNLEADQNLFTWSDVEVLVIGGEKGRSFTWKVNREQVLEDVIMALRLFPWEYPESKWRKSCV